MYNSEYYLDRCIEKIRRQTYQNFEVIIVDDSSTDKTYEKCVYYQGVDPRIRVVQTDKNRGAFFARLAGIRQANGYYVVFLDSDDYMDDDALSFFEKKMREGYDFISTGLVFEENSEKWNWTVTEGECTKGSSEMDKYIGGLLFRNEDDYKVCPSVCAKCFKRDFIIKCMEQVPTEEEANIIYFEDAMTTMICVLEAQKFICSSRLLYHYNRKSFSGIEYGPFWSKDRSEEKSNE